MEPIRLNHSPGAMPSRRLRLLVAIFAALLVVAYASGAFERDPSTVDVPTVDIPADRLERLELSGALDAVLVRIDSAWHLVEPYEAAADSAAVARFVTSLGGLALASLVSTNPERHARYGLDSTATRVEVTWEDGSATLEVSTRGPDWRSSYVRWADGPGVYATQARVALPASVEAMTARKDAGSPTGEDSY